MRTDGKKKLLCLTAIAVALFTAATACFAADTKEPLKIAYFVSELSNTFHQARFAAAKQYALDKYGIEVYAFDGKSDSAVMTENVDQIVAQGMDMAVLQIWDAEAAKPGVQEAIDKGVYIANFFGPFGQGINMPVIRNDEASSSKAMGAAAAAQWKKDNPDKPIVFVQIGWPDHTEVRSGRSDPFREGVLSVDPDAVDLGVLDGSAGADAAKQIMADLCTQRPEVNVIYSQASNLTVGVMAALQQAGRGKLENGKLTTEVVASVDCDQVELRLIYDPNNSLKMSLFLPPKDTSETIIDVLAQMREGKIKQISDEPEEFFAKSYPVIFWTTSSKEAVDLYNDQFNDNFSL
ncbi:MAG: substrate-binding domain-containing protein [Synergistaceae bacterium]|jgi:ABC-type sugar transport system substrate-binding protein|nr:substrate-binding domain-containing protein [Synergistaceae bacterium]